MTSQSRLIAVSDVSLDYGSPEIAALTDALSGHYGTRGLLLEPDETDRPPSAPRDTRHFDVRRLGSGLPSQTLSWRRDFLWRARQIIEAEKPDILFVCGGAVFPVLAALKHRPAQVIYFAYEQIADLAEPDQRAHTAMLADCDLVITPSPRRLIRDCETVSAWPRRVTGIVNSADVAYPEPITALPSGERNGRFFWCGALHRTRSFADWFLSDALSPFRIDLFGRISDPDPDPLRAGIEERDHLHHHGLVPADALNRARAESAFSLIWWNPENSFGHYHLASNRFFTSVCAGVPPIVGPHPQCVAYARRHDCAIVMDDWTLDALTRAMQQAADLYGSSAYDALVQRCLDAREDIGWAVQRDQVLSALRAMEDRS